MSDMVKLRNTQHEQMSSALPSRTDVGLARPIFVSPIRCYGMSMTALGQERSFPRKQLLPPGPDFGAIEATRSSVLNAAVANKLFIHSRDRTLTRPESLNEPIRGSQ
jgi:hypothetical protein